MREPTERQKDVLQRLSWGYTYPMIAEAMGISENTVKAHAERVYRRLEVHTRAAAVATAFRKGWIR